MATGVTGVTGTGRGAASEARQTCYGSTHLVHISVMDLMMRGSACATQHDLRAATSSSTCSTSWKGEGGHMKTVGEKSCLKGELTFN